MKRVDQFATAENQHILTSLLLESGNFFRQIALDQGGIPCHFREGSGKKVLRLVETRTLGSGVVLLTYQPDKP